MSDRTQAQRPRRAVPVMELEGQRCALPPWQDLAALVAEVQWLRSWTRHLEQQNERFSSIAAQQHNRIVTEPPPV